MHDLQKEVTFSIEISSHTREEKDRLLAEVAIGKAREVQQRLWTRGTKEAEAALQRVIDFVLENRNEPWTFEE